MNYSHAIHLFASDPFSCGGCAVPIAGRSGFGAGDVGFFVLFDAEHWLVVAQGFKCRIPSTKIGRFERNES